MRKAASVQFGTPSRDLFVTEGVISAEALNDESIQVNRRWYGEIWKGNQTDSNSTGYHSTIGTNAGIFFLLTLSQSRGTIFRRDGSRLINYDVMENVALWILGVSLAELRLISHYAIATTPRPLTYYNKLGIFSRAEMPATIIVGAAICGQEAIVLNILGADPDYLLKPAVVENSVGIKSIRTPLQAAIMANDIQMIQRMQKHFEQLPNGFVKMHEQMLAIYKESLRLYYEKQVAEIGAAIDEAALTMATERRDKYLKALRSDNMLDIVNAHNLAQAHYAFDFQPYMDAIINAPQSELNDVLALIDATTSEETEAVIARTGVSATQTDAARIKSFDQLTLVEKLNRFREKFVEHMQQEVIFNPNHILESLRQYERMLIAVDAGRIVDPGSYKRSVIFSQLIGWTQRKAAEPVKQDIRQGVWYLIKQNEPRRRQACFNSSGRNDYPDVSLITPSCVGGIGYKFARAGGWVRGRVQVLGVAYSCFSKLMLRKNTALSKLVTQFVRATPSHFVHQCVVQ